jgi:hypothetical protein
VRRTSISGSILKDSTPEIGPKEGRGKKLFRFPQRAPNCEKTNLYIRICIDKTIHFWYNDYVGVFYALTQKTRKFSGFHPLKPVSGFRAVSVFFSRMRGVSL